jgi:hypothetical protein
VPPEMLLTGLRFNRLVEHHCIALARRLRSSLTAFTYLPGIG